MRDWKQNWISNMPDIEGEDDRIEYFKLNATAEMMCASAKTKVFVALMKEAYSYSYKQRPRYDYLINLLM